MMGRSLNPRCHLARRGARAGSTRHPHPTPRSQTHVSIPSSIDLPLIVSSSLERSSEKSWSRIFGFWG
ncbi:hypothetical protein BU16DRAFT_113856 [Lophium mytilinum]|uniref:Uncharacterized protein n=1 Tax=Lophium mytilinum TaxID=390894 RepID=A0A6A6QJM1_9PEZI|nr:hypothetical protein BU16DRAFT_113856 [Lophium mytilinum]